jgi:hypothetical protein
MDEQTFRKKMADVIAQINELPTARQEELLALAQRTAARPAAPRPRPFQARRAFQRD